MFLRIMSEIDQRWMHVFKQRVHTEAISMNRWSLLHWLAYKSSPPTPNYINRSSRISMLIWGLKNLTYRWVNMVYTSSLVPKLHHRNKIYGLYRQVFCISQVTTQWFIENVQVSSDNPFFRVSKNLTSQAGRAFFIICTQLSLSLISGKSNMTNVCSFLKWKKKSNHKSNQKSNHNHTHHPSQV